MKAKLPIPRQHDLDAQVKTFGDTIANLAAYPTHPCRIDQDRLKQSALRAFFREFHKHNRILLREAALRASL